MWKTLSSKVIHKNPWHVLKEDDVVRPDGNKGKYYYIDGVNGIAAIAEDKDGYIYLVGQTRYPIGISYSWEIVTGGIRESLSPLVTAKQELQEEAGLLAKNWDELGYFYPCNGILSEKCFVYLARNLSTVSTNHEATEDITVDKKKIKDVVKMIEDDKITCGITVAAIYKYLLYKNKI